MNEKFKIRQATGADVSALSELWKEFMDFHKERDPHFSRATTGHENFAKFVAEHIQNDMSCVLVAEEKNEIIGYCMASIAKYPPVFEPTKYGTVFDLAVTEKYRRKGIGKRMFEEIERWFSERKIRRIELRVATSNEVSIAFWHKMGFIPYVETVYKEI